MERIKGFLINIFKDSNDINEQSLIGFVSFVIMILYSIVDVVTGIFGKDIEIKQYIYQGFETITISVFGIGAVKSILKK